MSSFISRLSLVMIAVCGILLMIHEARQATEQSLGRCVAASPAHTDSEVEAQWDACEKLLAHRRMIGR